MCVHGVMIKYGIDSDRGTWGTRFIRLAVYTECMVRLGKRSIVRGKNINVIKLIFIPAKIGRNLNYNS